MVDTAFNSFADGVVEDNDILLCQTAAGGGKNPRGSRFVKKDANGHVTIGAVRFGYAAATDTATINGVNIANYGLTFGGGFGSGSGIVVSGYSWMVFATHGEEQARLDVLGNWLVGTATGDGSRVLISAADSAEWSNAILTLKTAAGAGVLAAYNAAGVGWSSAQTAMVIAKNSVTGRSINAAGTINVTGADYAEYMTKADGCGTIAPGDVCGVDADGHLTQTWADAVSVVIKSTNPAYVGGDVWTGDLGPKPDAPDPAPTAPVVPVAPEPVGTAPEQPAREDGEDDAAFVQRVATYFAAAAAYQQRIDAEAAYQQRIDAYPAEKAAYDTALAAWQAAKDQYDQDLAAWNAAMEAERQKVDRIAFAGQVPVNPTGAVAVGDYLIAQEADDGGIDAVAVPAASMTIEQYRMRLGKVWAIRDGRPWVDVQHG